MAKHSLMLPDGVVWIASYPKSGNTWMRVLLSNLLAGGPEPQEINNLSLAEGIASSRGMFEAQTLVDSSLLTAEEIEALRPAVHGAYAASKSGAAFIKTHDAWTFTADGAPVLGRASARAALYLVRDPRDVAVSLAFFLATSIETAIDHMNSEANVLGPTVWQVRQRTGSWSTHARSWLDDPELPVFPIRYEDLRADTAGVFRRALACLDIRFESEAEAGHAIARAVRNSRFDELRRQEKDNGFAERGESLNMGTPEELFFRRGEAGDWRRHLTEAQVHRIETAHAPMMVRLGYEPATVRELAA